MGQPARALVHHRVIRVHGVTPRALKLCDGIFAHVQQSASCDINGFRAEARRSASSANKRTRALEFASAVPDRKSSDVTSMKKSAGFVSGGHLKCIVPKYPTALCASPVYTSLPSAISIS